MADLEKHAVRRDKRFLVRLVLLLVVGTMAGLLIYGQMTSEQAGACAADALGGPGGGQSGKSGGGSGQQ